MTCHRACNQINTTMSQVEQELRTLPDFPSLPPSPRFSVGFVLLDLQFDVYAFQIVVCSIVLFLLAIMLSVLRITDSDYPFGIFNFLKMSRLITHIILQTYLTDFLVKLKSRRGSPNSNKVYNILILQKLCIASDSMNFL